MSLATSRLFCLSFCALLGLPASILAQEFRSDWSLNQVTCHEVGALLTFEANLNVPGGEWRTVLPNVPVDASASGVQVSLPTGIRLVAVNEREEYAQIGREVEQMEQDIRAKHLALELEYAVLSTLDQERAFLEANQSIGGESDVLLVDDLEEMRAYIVNRHEELALDRVDVNLAIEELNEEIMALTAQMDSLKASALRPRKALELVLSGQGRGSAKIKVATELAGWVTSYDVSWNDAQGELNMERFARVVQTTGHDWSNVELELRTGQPLAFLSPPTTRPQLQSTDVAQYDGYCANVHWVNSKLDDKNARRDVLNGQGAMASNWKMNVDSPVTIGGDGAVARIWLDSVASSATPMWTARPGVSESAYRSCHTHSWMDWKALSGESRVFHGNAMVGVLPMNMPAWGDSLVVQLGLDDQIRSTTKLVADESGTKKLTGKHIVEQVRTIQVHNSGDSEATVNVIEQLPLGPGWEMEVDASHDGGWDPSTGEVTWSSLKIPSDNEWQGTIHIRIVIPRGGSLVGL